MADDLNAPIDRLQAECLIAQRDIRRRVRALREEVARWQPRPRVVHIDRLHADDIEAGLRRLGRKDW